MILGMFLCWDKVLERIRKSRVESQGNVRAVYEDAARLFVILAGT